MKTREEFLEILYVTALLFKNTLKSRAVSNFPRDNPFYNKTVFLDTFYIDNKPIVRVVDEATEFQAARWLNGFSAE